MYSHIHITKREHEILQYICQGYSMHEIGQQLYVAESTVISHKKNLFRKFEVNNVVKLAVEAIRFKLYQL